MIYIMCVLRLRVDVIYINYRANGEYALRFIKILYWCNWKELNTITNLCVIIRWFSKGIICKYLVWSSILFWSGRLFYSFRFITFWFWFLWCNFMVTILPPPTFFDLKYIVVWVFFLQVCIQIRNRDQKMNCHYYCCYLLIVFFFFFFIWGSKGRIVALRFNW